MIFCMPFDFHWKREKERAKWRSYNISIQWRFVLLLELIEHTSFITFYSICDRSLSLCAERFYYRKHNTRNTFNEMSTSTTLSFSIDEKFHAFNISKKFSRSKPFFLLFCGNKIDWICIDPISSKFKEMETVKKLKCSPNCEEMYFWSRFISFIRPHSRNQYYLVNFQIIQSKHALLGKGFWHSIGKRVSSSEINITRNEHLVSPSDFRGWKNHI